MRGQDFQSSRIIKAWSPASADAVTMSGQCRIEAPIPYSTTNTEPATKAMIPSHRGLTLKGVALVIGRLRGDTKTVPISPTIKTKHAVICPIEAQ